jgi:hypothetical protein
MLSVAAVAFVLGCVSWRRKAFFEMIAARHREQEMELSQLMRLAKGLERKGLLPTRTAEAIKHRAEREGRMKQMYELAADHPLLPVQRSSLRGDTDSY